MKELNLYDIKPLVSVPDLSLYAFIALVTMAILVLGLIAYLIYSFLIYKKNSERQHYYTLLKNIDLNDSKKSAYVITQCGWKLIQTDHEKKFFLLLLEELEMYKYKKEVPPFSRTTLIRLETFMDELDV
ncbi:hypothetical protein [Candidatus Marinarcus aquaticus]|uniref:Uncharacterized protein n=1 Tax=Candidatus Marinarcus aquaticus TaxID=2044504 RepID=A0A4Q0XT06_9BACT|nr:hypothetical protein [Candidatus Marinarcus aquaticus]RXJ60506.1 hypothetical protein CRV04_00380 [Candidatus Marinarcus aquaticus]